MWDLSEFRTEENPIDTLGALGADLSLYFYIWCRWLSDSMWTAFFFFFKFLISFLSFSLEDFAAEVSCFSLISFQKQVYTPNVPLNEALFYFSVSYNYGQIDFGWAISHLLGKTIVNA